MTEKNFEEQEMQAQAGADAPEAVKAEAEEAGAESESAAHGAPEAVELDTAELLETIARLEAELAEANQQAAELTEKSQRLAAEFQNSRRRQERQLAEQIERSSMHLVKRLLPVMDDFDLAFANVPETTDAEAAWIDGFRQIQRKLRQLLEEEGVTPIVTEGAFDPTLHEAIASAPSETVESGHIIETLRAGYQLKGHVLRPALVRVAM